MASIEKLTEQAKQYMEANESVVATVAGLYESKMFGQDTYRRGVLIATSARVVFYGKKLIGYELEVFPYSNISSIEMSKGFLGHKISFFAVGNKVSMIRIGEGDVLKLVNHIRDNIGKKHTSAADDTAEQIQKLHELKEKGILTDEEFQAKKKLLLGL